MKTSRRRLDVDVEELDRVIDAAENGPLGTADRPFHASDVWRLT